MDITTTLLIYTSILGFILGYVVNKTNFCTMGAVSDLVNIGDSSRFKAWLLAIATAIVGVTLLEYMSIVDIDESRIPYRNSVFFWPRYILGGIMFGIGMTLASGCGNKILIRIGGGNIKSIFVLIVAGLMALLMTRTDFYGLLFHSWMNPISPDLAKLGISDQSIQTMFSSITGIESNNMIITILVPAIISILLLKYIFSSYSKLSSDNILSGIVVGLVVTFAWLISGGELGQAWIENNDFLDTPYPSVGVQSFTFINPMGELLIYSSSVFDSFYLTFGVTALISTVCGSFIYALISNNLRLEWFANKHDFYRHLLGAVLIGIGGVLSLGCTIGQGVTGVSTLALGSIITLISIIFGASLMMKIEYYRAVYEDSSFFELLKNSLIDLKVLPKKIRTLEKI
ncbi:MAG: YeeE/YedE family protein [Gammaproteobacteria bacterium]|nr:YeeE/YedE family protein [Gammaproteobacteria bacterium]MBL6819122.1 YeeE/YedE family protein [Gammaproteobacteria bacterium]MBL6898773.1 YeeE/YedE family protein [Gammaproteobacteria bacterium]